jgi:hypothetical protein
MVQVMELMGRLAIHDPDLQNGPLYQYLKKCADLVGGIMDEPKVAVISYDFQGGSLQDGDLALKADRKYESGPKGLLKYFMFRIGV